MVICEGCNDRFINHFKDKICICDIYLSPFKGDENGLILINLTYVQNDIYVSPFKGVT